MEELQNGGLAAMQALVCPQKDALTFIGNGQGFGSMFGMLALSYIHAAGTGLTYCTFRWSGGLGGHGVDAGEMYDWVNGDKYGPPSIPSTRQIKNSNEIS